MKRSTGTWLVCGVGRVAGVPEELRVAVIGSGPAGVYAAGALTAGHEAADHVRVDVLDRLPAPYGLVRYGVAPDHVKMKSVEKALAQVLSRPGVRFLGNVELGRDVTVDELRAHYHAIVYATGSSADRHLGVPGEDLPGSFSATEFVAWYNGHPDAQLDVFALQAEAVAVVGAGNVALDVARVLVREVDELARTDVPDSVLRVLRRRAVRDVHVLIRRGPVQTKFTTKELHELGELPGVAVRVDPASVADVSSEDHVAARNLAVFQEWAARQHPGGDVRTLHVHFLTRPVELAGRGVVERLRLERTALDDAGNAVGTGDFQDLPVQMVLRSVGYLGQPLPGVPFDERAGTVPNEAGRVLRGGEVSPGEYVTGWLRRGPTGIIGTNRHDASEVMALLVADAAALPAPAEDGDVVDLLGARGVTVVPWQGWERIDAAEVAAGRSSDRARAKLASWDVLLAAAAAADRDDDQLADHES